MASSIQAQLLLRRLRGGDLPLVEEGEPLLVTQEEVSPAIVAAEPQLVLTAEPAAGITPAAV